MGPVPSLRDSIRFQPPEIPTLKRGANEHCASGTSASIQPNPAPATPTPKRVADKHCASGASVSVLEKLRGNKKSGMNWRHEFTSS
jgi:hypothetical protein